MNFFEKKQNRLVLEAGAEWLKWAVLSGSGGSSRILEMGLIELADANAPAKLSAAAKKYKIPPAAVAGCLSRSQVTARNLELPSTDPVEIKKIVDLQAVKQTPYSSDEIVYGYYLLDTFREGYSSVMLVIAHRDVLNAYLNVVRNAGLQSPWITLGTECASAWVARIRPAGPAREAVAVVDVDAAHTDFYIFRDDSILFTQNLLFGSDKIRSNPEAVTAKLLEEISRNFHIYRSEEISKEPSTLLLCGAYGALLPMTEKISSATGMKVEVLALPREASEALERAEGSREWVDRFSFSAVLGLAMRSKTPPINLLPHEIVIQESLVKKSHTLFITGLLSLSIFLVVIASFAARYYEKLSYLKWLQDKTSVTAKPAEDVLTKKKRIAQILSIHQADIRFFDEFLHLVRAVSSDIYLTEINWTKEGHFLLQGRSTSMTSVFNFVNDLKASKAFRSVESKRLTKRIVENKEVVDFEIDSEVVHDMAQTAA